MGYSVTITGVTGDAPPAARPQVWRSLISGRGWIPGHHLGFLCASERARQPAAEWWAVPAAQGAGPPQQLMSRAGATSAKALVSRAASAKALASGAGESAGAKVAAGAAGGGGKAPFDLRKSLGGTSGSGPAIPHLPRARVCRAPADAHCARPD